MIGVLATCFDILCVNEELLMPHFIVLVSARLSGTKIDALLQPGDNTITNIRDISRIRSYECYPKRDSACCLNLQPKS